MLQNSVTRCRSEEGTDKHRNTEFQDCVDRRCREFRTRYQHRRSHADNRCPGDGDSFLRNRASSNTSKVAMNSDISNEIRPTLLSCEAETGIHTSEWRVHWPLPRSGDG